MKSLLDDVELFRSVEGFSDRGEAAVVEVNDRVSDLIGTTETTGDACDNGINAKSLAMMLHTGALAAIDIAEDLDEQGERALGTLLLAYWGLDLEIADPRAEAWSPVAASVTALEGA